MKIKFLVKISPFEFLVMTEKNIFACKLFLPSNISDFSFFIFFVKIATSPEKSYPSLFQQPPLKVEVLSSHPFFENLVGCSNRPPSPQ